jgi:alpha-glucosidase
MLLLTLRGTPTLYYGDEIGMHQVAIAPDQVRDPFEKNVPGIGVGRDGCRTPMQWDATQRRLLDRDAVAAAGHDFATRTSSISMPTPDRSSALQGADQAAQAIAAAHRGSYEPVAAQGDLLLYRRGRGEALIIALEPRRRARLGHLKLDRIRQRNSAVDIPRPQRRKHRGRAGSARQ